MAKSSCAIVLLLLVTFASNASAADLFCADKSGKLSVRPACKKGERVVPVNVPGPMGPKGDTGEPGPTAPSIYDSTGLRIGHMMGSGCPGGQGEATLIHTIASLGDSLYFLCFNKNGYRSIDAGLETYYTSMDCSGSAFASPSVVQARRAGFVPHPLVLPPASTLYEVPTGAVAADTNYRSYLHETGSCIQASGVLSLVPVTRVADMDEIFVPPIEVR